MIFVGIGGPSTSGKTTICKYLAKKYKTFYIEGDNYFKNKENIPTKGKLVLVSHKIRVFQKEFYACIFRAINCVIL